MVIILFRTKTIDFNGGKITVNELTAAQVDDWEDDVLSEKVKMHRRDKLMNHVLPISVICIATPSLTEKDLGAAPSELIKIYDAVEELNPFLFQMAERMSNLGDLLGLGGENDEV